MKKSKVLLPSFSGVKVETTAERIVRQIIAQISEGKLEPGDKLPPEKILGEQFQASRPSIREAIHTLKVIGLVSVRQGDGAYINRISHGALSDYFSVLNKIGQFTLSQVSEVRLLLEPLIGELVVERAKKEDLLKLEKMLRETKERIESKRNPSTASIGFHRLLGNTCKNPLLSLILDSVLDLLVKEISKFSSDMKTNEDAYSMHERIFRAIRDKNAAAVSRYIREDIRVTHVNLQRVVKGCKQPKPK